MVTVSSNATGSLMHENIEMHRNPSISRQICMSLALNKHKIQYMQESFSCSYTRTTGGSSVHDIP